jgi:hypothetical protein
MEQPNFVDHFFRHHHSAAVRIVGHPHFIVLAFIFFPATHHSITTGKNVHRFVACIFDGALAVEIMELGTDHACVFVFFENFKQSFDQARSEFCVVIDNKEKVAFCGPDANIVSAAKSKVFFCATNDSLWVNGF